MEQVDFAIVTNQDISSSLKTIHTDPATGKRQDMPLS